jgi:formate-dependent nitrite reductase membrane component NrfD
MVAASADSVVARWLAVSVAVNFVAAANFVVVDSMIATSGAAASDSATRMTTMTTTLTLIRMDIGMAITRMDMAIIRTPPAMGTKTTAVAM